MFPHRVWAPKYGFSFCPCSFIYVPPRSRSNPQSVELVTPVIKKIMSPAFRMRYNIAVGSRSDTLRDLDLFGLGEDHVNAVFSSEMYHRGTVEAWLRQLMMRSDAIGGDAIREHRTAGNQVFATLSMACDNLSVPPR
jgi:hypothetical protein